MGQPNVKGTVMRGMIASIERICPKATVDDMVLLLGEPLGNQLKHRAFIASGWYPVRDFRALLGAAMKVTGRDVELIEVLARDAALHEFRGLFRLITFALSPDFLMRRTAGMFSRYYDTGTLTVPIAKKGYAEARYRGFAGFDRVLWNELIAGCRAILEVCGARDIRGRLVRGGGDGDVDLDLVVEWC
jgi:hypothetical protein